MKYLIFSDLHGSLLGLERLKACIHEEKPDVVICLGDILYGAYDGNATKCVAYLSNLEMPLLGVKGNCDVSNEEAVLRVHLPSQHIFFFHNHRIIIAHAPFYYAFQLNDIAMFGHTHVKQLYKENGVYYLNPGSIGKPRDGVASYAILSEEGLFLKSAETFELLKHEYI